MAKDTSKDDPVFRVRVPRAVTAILAKQARENQVTISAQIRNILSEVIHMQNMAEQVARMERQVAELKKRRDKDE